MHRSNGFSATRLRHYPWYILPGFIVVLLVLFASVLADTAPRAHAASQSSLNYMRKTEFIHNHSDGYHPKESTLLAEQLAKISHLNLNKSSDLTLTRTTLSETTSHGKHTIQYRLAVNNSRLAGPVEAGNTITISNSLPAGLTDLTASAKNSDWQMELDAKTGPTKLTATYVGAYPVLAGATLSPITISGVLENPTAHHVLTLAPAIVRVVQGNNSAKTGSVTLQQQSSHDFTVKGTTRLGAAPRTTPQNSPATTTRTVPGTTPRSTPGTTSGTTTGTTPRSTPGTASGTTTGTTPRSTPGTTTGMVSGTTTGTTPRSTPGTTTGMASGTTTGTTPRSTPGTTTGTAPGTTPQRAKGVTPFVAPSYQSGQQISYTLSISNGSTAGPVITGDSIVVTDPIPAGLTGLTATAATPSDWTLSLGATTSPTTLTATYTGTLPVATGATLSTITITGTLTSAAVPSGIANTATVVTPNDSNNSNNSGTNTISSVLAAPDLTVTDPTPSGAIGGTFQVGKPVTYTLTGSNVSGSGPVQSNDAITIVDTIPAGLTGMVATAAVPADWTLVLGATSGATTLTATYKGTYPVNGGTTLSAITLTGTLTTAALTTLANSATISTPLDSNAANNTASNSITVMAQPDMTITKTPSAGPYQVSLPVSYTLTASNVSGAGSVLTGDSIVVTDSIPAGLSGLTVTAATPADWTITALGSTTSPTTLTATYKGTFPVAAGTTLSALTISGTWTSAATSPFVNTATVTTPNDSNTANNSGSSSITVLATPDLTVTDPTPSGAIGGTFQVGKSVTYTLTGSNVTGSGPVPTGDAITITDTIPAGLTGMVATAAVPSDWTLVLGATSGATTLTATYKGTLPLNGGTALSAITLTGTLTTSAISTLTNSATISTPKDANSANNTASNSITVTAQPDMTITKTVPTGVTFQVGHTVTYTLTPSNVSGVGSVLTGDSIVITDPIPVGFSGLTATAITSSDWTVTMAGTPSTAGTATTSPTTLTATYKGAYPVTAGTSLSAITVTGTLTSAALSGVTNIATVTTPNDSNSANNTSTSTISVVKQPDLTLTKTVQLIASLEVQGKRFRSTIDVKNANKAGPVLPGDAITVIDKLPAGLIHLVTSTNRRYWHVKLDTTTSPTTMTATYVGPYPVLRGTTLPAILLNGILVESRGLKFTKAVVVTGTRSNPGGGNSHHSGRQTHPAGTILASRKPKLSLSNSGKLGPAFQGGQQVVYKLTVSNKSGAGPVIAGDPITVIDTIPVGLTALKPNVDSLYWQTALKSTTSPTTFIATYVGPYPVAPGTMLPSILLNGTLTGASSKLTNTAIVNTPADSSTTSVSGHSGTTTIRVIPAPDMAITKTNGGGNTFRPGQMVQYTLHVYTTSASGPVKSSSPIRVIDALPTEASDVKAYGAEWRINVQPSSNGTTVEALYTGPYPLGPNASLPLITIDAKVKGHSGTRVVNTAQVVIPYDSNPSNNVSPDAIFIRTPALPPTGSDPNW